MKLMNLKLTKPKSKKMKLLEIVEKTIGIKTVNLCINASRLAYRSNIVFDDVSEIETFADGENSVNGFYAEIDPETILIAFRGSDDIEDFVHNVRVSFKRLSYHNNPYSPVMVHEGFGNLYDLVRGLIHSYIADKALTPKKIVVTGHSLGAALATLCALDLQYNYSELGIEIICITTGSPRVGNRDFVNSYNIRVPKTVRVVNGNDIVARLPFWLMGYRHVSERFQIGSRKKWWNFLRGSIRDHKGYSEINL